MKKLALVALGTVAASGAFAAAAPMMAVSTIQPWYVGVGVNYSANMTDRVTTNNIIEAGDTLNVHLSSRGWGGNVFAGYMMNKYLGAELGLSYVGTNKYTGTYTSAAGAVSSATAKVQNQWNVHFVGNAYLPLTDWFAPYAFAGVGYMNAQLRASDTTVAYSESEKLGTFGFVYGGGVQFNINQFGIRAYYTRLDPSDSLSSSVIPEQKDYISLDVLYRFGA